MDKRIDKAKDEYMKKISVIMGVYNCEKTLVEAIESLLQQTYDCWELIMCDDGSKDGTLKIAESYCKRFPDKIKLLKNEKNLGLNETLNRCLAEATGDYIARMDGDDISLPTRFEVEAEFLDSHPNYSIVGTPMIMFDAEGDWGETKCIEKPQKKDFVFSPPVHCHATVMVRREAYMMVNGYTVDRRLLRYEDCNLWYKMYSKGYIGYNLKSPLYKMRDDRNAFKRRTFESRLRAVYVQWTGFNMYYMDIKYYPYLVVEFAKSVVVGLLPERMYMSLHRKRQGANNDT